MSERAPIQESSPSNGARLTIAESLGRLLGPSPRDWYLDACRLAGPPLDDHLRSSALLIPLLLSLIEQKLRTVLLPAGFTPQPGEDARAQEIRDIAAAYELAPESQRHWLCCLDRLDQAREEGSTDPARAPGLGALLADCEELFRSLLDVLGNNYLAVLSQLKSMEDEPDVNALRALLARLPESGVVQERLIEKLPKNSRYLDVLHRLGFFRRPPGPVRDRQGELRPDPDWSALRYLAKLVPLHPDEVARVLHEIPLTENRSVHCQMAELAATLPGPLAAEWTLRELTWLKTQQTGRMRLHEPLRALAAALIEKGQIPAAQELLRVLFLYGVPSAEQRELPTELSNWLDYDRRSLVTSCIQPLVHADPEAALELLCEFIEAAYRLDPFGEVDEVAQRPEADTNALGMPNLKRLLIDAARVAAERLATRTPLSALLERLGRQRQSIFRRLALHLLRHQPAASSVLLRPYLLDRVAFSSGELEPEYSLLLGEQLGKLSVPDQQTVASWIQQGPPPEEMTWLREGESGSDERTRYIDGWTYQRLRNMGPSRSLLPSFLRARYEQLRGQYEPEPAPKHVPSKTAEEILALGRPELKEFLLSWDPGPEERTWGMRNNQADALREAVAQKPEHFLDRFGLLHLVHDRYVRAFLNGLAEALRDGRGSVPPDLLHFLRLKLGSAKLCESREDGGQPGGRELHLSVARLLRAAFHREQSLLSLDDSEPLFDVLRSLLSLPTESFRQALRSENRGPLAHQIEHQLFNSPRGIAFGVLLQAAVQFQLAREKHGQSKLPLRDLFGMQDLLDRLLTEQGPLIQGAFGQSIWTLLWLDPQWTAASLGRIFPTQPADQERFSAAWEMYLMCGPGFPGDPEHFFLMRFAYEHAVHHLAAHEAEDSSDSARATKTLAAHLAGLYLSNLLDLSPDGLLATFLVRAPDPLRAAVLRSAAQGVERRRARRATDETGPSGGPANEVERERAVALWTSRCSAIFAEPKAHSEEAGAFFAYAMRDVFEPNWVLEQLERVLPLGRFDLYEARRMQERLAELAAEHPVACMRCLDGYLQRMPWLINIHTKAAKTIFEAALKGPDAAVARLARHWVNRLVASGVTEERMASIAGPDPDS